MFEVNVGGKQYRISFKYFDGFSDDLRDEPDAVIRYTRIKLEMIVEGERVAVAHADSACSTIEGRREIDRRKSRGGSFSKDRGRKEALTRLMDTDRETLAMSPTDAEDYLSHKRSLPSGDWRVIVSPMDMPDFDDRDVRLAFWKAYFGRQNEDRARNTPPIGTGPFPSETDPLVKYLGGDKEEIEKTLSELLHRFVQQAVDQNAEAIARLE